MKNIDNIVQIRNYSIRVIVFVISIMTIGISVSYAYFTANFTGENNIPINTASVLNVTSNIDEAEPITSAELGLINKSDYKTKAEEVTFQITNHASSTGDLPNEQASTIKAKYTVKIVEMSLSKNLFSKYLKWALVKNNEEVPFATGDFKDEQYNTQYPEGYKIEANRSVDETTGMVTYTPKEEDIISIDTKELLTTDKAQVLEIGQTDTLHFYIWLENDPDQDQLYLTNGLFKGKLAVDAVPYRGESTP